MPAFDSPTTRMPQGVTNAAPWQTLAAAGFPDPGYAHIYHNDFDDYNANDWTIATTGTGTIALGDLGGGRLVVNTSAGIADANYLQKVNATFGIGAGSQLFFKFAGTISELTNNAFYTGLVQKGATTITSITDGIFISKAAGSTQFVLNVRKASAAVTVNLPVSCVPTINTIFELGFMVDMQGNVAAFFNPTTGNDVAIAAGGIRGRVAALYGPALPTVMLTPAFGLLNSTAVARNIAVDFITVGRER